MRYLRVVRRLLPLALITVAGLAPLPPMPVLAADPVVLNVPWRTQFDDSLYAAANCGPATMGMILAAFGRDVATNDLRKIVIQLQGSAGYDDGTYIENLGRIAERHGVLGLQLTNDNGQYHHWTLEDIRYQLRAGRPVVPQVNYRSLPGHEDSEYYGDHYIAVIGFDAADFLYLDSAMRGPEAGARRISGDQLYLAMKRSDFPFVALSFAADGGSVGVPRLPVVRIAPAITPAPKAASVVTRPAVPAPEPRSGTIRQAEGASGPSGAPATVPLRKAKSTGAVWTDGYTWLITLVLPVLMAVLRSRWLFEGRRLQLASSRLWFSRRFPAAEP